MAIDLIGRICRDEYNELDLDNVKMYTKKQLIDEYKQIDYIDEEEIEEIGIDNIELMELQEVAEMNNEYLIFTDFEPEKEYSICIDMLADLDEVHEQIEKEGIKIKASYGDNTIKTDYDNLIKIEHILTALGVHFDVAEITVSE